MENLFEMTAFCRAMNCPDLQERNTPDEYCFLRDDPERCRFSAMQLYRWLQQYSPFDINSFLDENESCPHPDINVVDISGYCDDFYDLSDEEKVFYCHVCQHYQFVHRHGESIWVPSQEQLGTEIQKMRSIEVFYNRNLKIEDHLTEEAKLKKGDPMRFMEQLGNAEPEMYED